jgi:glycerol-3-phosphate dehydrogenase
MSIDFRKNQLEAIEQIDFDVVIVGGGISGAAVFQRLALAGYRVLLLEKGDFGGGTSQSSAMMIWGNLADLRRLNLINVGRSCRSRENLIRTKSDWVIPHKFRFLPLKNGRKPVSSYLAHYAYWLLGAGRRSIPRYRKDFTESCFLKSENFPYSFEYEEASLESSDARFVLGWILSRQYSFEKTAINYCGLSGGRYDSFDKRWHLEINDSICGREISVKTKCVVNAAGVWTDNLNRGFGIDAPYKHVFGKGVFLGIKRPACHQSTLMIETKEDEGCLALIPWGQISLWGPTETRVKNLDEGFSATPADVRFLLKQLNRHLSKPVSTEDIVSLRCGVRPLPAKLSFSDEESDILSITRQYKTHADRALPWISIYGGKITSCGLMAKRVENLLKNYLSMPRAASRTSVSFDVLSPQLESFPNLAEKVPSARRCAEKEMCWNLEDYLRRRTNISQWIARGGLGQKDENLPHLKNLAKIFCPDDESKANKTIDAYRQKIKREFDEVLAEVL